MDEGDRFWQPGEANADPARMPLGEFARRFQGAARRHCQQNVARGRAHAQGETPGTSQTFQRDAIDRPLMRHFDFGDWGRRDTTFEKAKHIEAS